MSNQLDLTPRNLLASPPGSPLRVEAIRALAQMISYKIAPNLAQSPLAGYFVDDRVWDPTQDSRCWFGFHDELHLPALHQIIRELGLEDSYADLVGFFLPHPCSPADLAMASPLVRSAALLQILQNRAAAAHPTGRVPVSAAKENK